MTYLQMVAISSELCYLRMNITHAPEALQYQQLYQSFATDNQLRQKKNIYIYICVFQDSALKKLGMVGRHNILSKYFI